MAPLIEYSTKEERMEFILDKYRCKAPACGSCLSCKLPSGLSAIDTFSEYIEGKVEYVIIASKLWR